jgi:hypothetical protein
VDRSLTQIEHARRHASSLDLEHIDFMAADAVQLDAIRDGEFDIAVISLVIHEMPADIRLPVLREIRRIARRVIMVDWEARQPTVWRRIGAHVIERLAGGEHYRGFRSFVNNGGIPALLEQTDLIVVDEQGTSKGTLRVWLCATA